MPALMVMGMLFLLALQTVPLAPIPIYSVLRLDALAVWAGVCVVIDLVMSWAVFA
jgi:hypothetical protein